MHQRPHELSRRRFLARAGGAAIALPSLSAILAACAKPGAAPAEGGPSVTGIPLATLESPVELPVERDPIPADTPIESGTLHLYNWDAYLYKKVIKDFEEEFGVSVEVTTFNNMEEGVQKFVAGQVEPDVFFPTPGYLRRLVERDLLAPLQHELVPNMLASVWPSYSDPGPYYDLGWRYSVPYTVYTWGVAYRRDRVSDDDLAAQGWEALWNHDYDAEISLYDSYGDTLSVAILRNGSLDVNSGDPVVIDRAKEAVIQTINDNRARLTINGAFAKLPEGEFTVAEAWSGDTVTSQWYLPKGVDTDVLGFWRPPPGETMISNDLMVIPANAPHPRLAHEFLNFMLDGHHGFENFASWNGYQPPFTTIDPATLVERGVVPANLAAAVVNEEMFTKDLTPVELPPDVDELWLAAWAEIKAGG